MRYTATVSSKRQFTIPKAIREQLGIKPGDHVAVTVEDSMIKLTPSDSDEPMRNEDRYITTNLRFPEDVYEWLKMEAVRQHKSLAALIREMLRRQREREAA